MLGVDRRWLVFLAICTLACTPPKLDGGDDEASTGGDLMPWDLYAEAECSAYADCGCSSPMGLAADLDTCIETRRQALGAIAETSSYAWDPACAQERLDRIAASCTFDQAALDQAECTGECSLFVGTADEEAACSSVERRGRRPSVQPARRPCLRRGARLRR